MSTKSLQEKLVPESMNQKLLVVSKIEDPELLQERRQMVQSKSVSELSQISNFSDIPLPNQVEKFLTLSRSSKRSRTSKSQSENPDHVQNKAPKDYHQFSPMAIHDSIYSTLPRSMKSELLVKSKVKLNNDEAKARRQLVLSKSVGELSQVNKLSDLPVPTPIQTLINRRKRGAENMSEDDASSQYTGWTGTSSRLARYTDLYSTLPSSWRREVFVRSKIGTDYDTLKKRKDIVETKSPAELSQISNLSELPIPRKIEEWLNQPPGYNNRI